MKKTIWTKQRCQQEALKYKTRTEFYKNSTSAYTTAKCNDWLNPICTHMKITRTPKGYWTKQRCHQEALKYNTKSDFRKNEEGAYITSLRKDWLNDISSHMNLIRRINYFVYSFEFSDNSVYIGLTQRPDTRKNQHSSDTNSKVYVHTQQTGLQPEFKILAESPNNHIGQVIEKSISDDYVSNNWKKLN